MKILINFFFALMAFCLCALTASADWAAAFNEDTSVVAFKNGSVKISGKLEFRQACGDGKWADSSGKIRDLKNGESWRIANARDGVDGRLSIIDPRGDVQGYVVFPHNGDTLDILFYHRTAQSFKGRLFFDAKVKFYADAYSCDAFPNSSESALRFKFGEAESALDDALFSPEKDVAIRFASESKKISKLGEGSFSVKMSGEIGNGEKSEFNIDLLKNYFKETYIPNYVSLAKKGLKKTPTGWMSWNVYFDKATAEDNLSEARIGAKYLKPFGCEFWSIESWQGNSDELPVEKFYNMDGEVNAAQFPLGMKKLAEDIRALGFRPGIWVAPFATGNAQFYKAHKNWFLHDENGKAISCWNGKYTLDPTVPEAREHLKNLFKKMADDWGYEFFKIDGMSGRNKSYCAHMYERPEIRARFADPKCDNPFELCVKAFREGIGKKSIFLACQGHATGAEAAYAELARSGADIVSPNQPVKWENVLRQGSCTTNQAFSHNVCMVLDPDTLLVRDLGLEQARVSATIIALPGQLTFFGDKLAGLSPEKMKILQQTLPVQSALPARLYPIMKELPLWVLDVKSDALKEFKVVAFFNWGDKDAEIEASLFDLGIEKPSTWLAFEFWEQKFLGAKKIDKKSPLKIKVPARGVRLLRLTKESGAEAANNAPEYLGSDRHVSQTGFEVKSLEWNGEKRELECGVLLVEKFPTTFSFYIPRGLKFSKATSDDAKIETELDGDVLRVNVVSNSSEEDVKFNVKF